MPYKIHVSTPILVYTGFNEDGGYVFATSEFLKTLDGYEYDFDREKNPISIFIEYEGPKLSQIGASLTLRYNEHKNLLEAHSNFEVAVEPTQDDIFTFLDEYQIQMSDGFGECMTQNLTDTHRIEFEFSPYRDDMAPSLSVTPA